MSASAQLSPLVADIFQDRYKAFLRMMQQWRHLHLLKRVGRGYYAKRVDGTKPGELAIICPACPQPGINLSPNWVRECCEKPCVQISNIASL
jgi:hypothetical protein